MKLLAPIVSHARTAATDGRALLTIGLPVYNGAGTIDRALDALQAQTWGDFQLLISDNRSSDGTGAIIAERVRTDPRLRLLPPAEHLTAPFNFKRLVDAADTEFFMFAPADDMWDTRYVEACMARLLADPGLSLCCTRTDFIDARGRRRAAMGTFPIVGQPGERVATYLGATRDNSRFYGIHRTGHLKRGFDRLSDVIAWDWMVLVPGLLAGAHAEVPETLLLRQRTPRQNYRRLVRRTEPGVATRIFPASRVKGQIEGMLADAGTPSTRAALRRMNLLTMSISPYLPARLAGYVARAFYLAGDAIRRRAPFSSP